MRCPPIRGDTRARPSGVIALPVLSPARRSTNGGKGGATWPSPRSRAPLALVSVAGVPFFGKRKKVGAKRRRQVGARYCLLSDDGFPREAWAGYWLAGDKSLRPHHSKQGMPSRRILFGAERIINDGSHTAQCCGPLLEPTEAIAWQQSIFENTKDDWYSRLLLWIWN